MDASKPTGRKLSTKRTREQQRKSIDASYKLLFSQPTMVIDLLKGYVKQEWIEQLDFSTLEQVPTNFVSSRLHQRHNDCIWRVLWQGTKRWLYVYVVLEFQSKADWMMPLRMMTYLGLLYEEIVKVNGCTRKDKLPPVLPMVLYNGKSPWKFTTQLYDLIDVIPGGIEQFIPRFDFLLLEEHKYKDHPLPATRNLVAALFKLETSQREDDLLHAFEAVKHWLEQEEQKSLNKAFLAWMKGVLLPSRWEHIDFEQVDDLEGVQSMLEETVVEWKQNWNKEGLAEGLQKGKAEGQREMLVKLLQAKFAHLPDAYVTQIESASSAELKRWLMNTLQASTVEDVFQN